MTINQKQVNMVLAEFFGTTVLALVIYTILARTGFPFFTGMAAGVAVGLLTLVLGTFANVHLNPAVTFGLWSIRKVKTVEAIAKIGAQMLGGLAAWMLLKYFLGHPLSSLAGDDFDWKVFTAEAVGAFVLVFGVASAVYQKYSQALMGLAAGGSLFLGILVASLASNGVVNPAVAVGVQSWSWVYAVAPLVGAVLGANIYGIMSSPIKLARKPVAKKRK